MKKLDTLVNDIYGMFDGNHFPNDKQDFVAFGKAVEELFHTRFNTIRQQPTLRISNIGKPDRQLWYDLNYKGEREALPPPTLIKFTYGDMLEQMMLLYTRMSGHTVEEEQSEIVINGIKGHIDAIIDGVVVDIKSASSYSFQKFENREILQPGKDPFGYIGQLAGYVHAMTPGKGGAFLVVDKTLGKICLMEVTPEELQKYDVETRINDVKEMVKSEDVPQRCYDDIPDGKSGNMKLPVGCSYCSHKFHCWDNLKTYYYSTGPKYLTKVVREPRVSEFPD